MYDFLVQMLNYKFIGSHNLSKMSQNIYALCIWLVIGGNHVQTSKTTHKINYLVYVYGSLKVSKWLQKKKKSACAKIFVTAGSMYTIQIRQVTQIRYHYYLFGHLQNILINTLLQKLNECHFTWSFKICKIPGGGGVLVWKM